MDAALSGFNDVVEKIVNEDATHAVNSANLLTRVLDAAEDNAKKEWKTIKEDRISANMGIIKALESIIDDDTAIHNLDLLKGKIMSLDMGNENMIRMMDDYVEKSRKLIQEMNMDKDVEKVIIKASNGEEVYLEEIVGKPLDWIKEHNLTKKFKVTI